MIYSHYLFDDCDCSPQSDWVYTVTSRLLLRHLEGDKYKVIIKEIFDGSKGRFGSMMIRAKMKEQGYQISQNRILRLMREMDLQCNRSKGTLAEYKQAYIPRIYTTNNKLNRQLKQTEPIVYG